MDTNEFRPEGGGESAHDFGLRLAEALSRQEKLAEFGARVLEWYRETEARAAAHPLIWHRPPRDLRERVAELVREVAPEPLDCPCTSCRNSRAGGRKS